MSAWLPAWPWWIWLGIAWVVVVLLIVWLNHYYTKHIRASMQQWEDDEHRDSAT